MVKNWLHYVGGSWRYDQPLTKGDENRWVWTEQGVVYLDPATVVSVGDNDDPKATIICTSDGKQVVTRQKSASEIIADIQSALAD